MTQGWGRLPLAKKTHFFVDGMLLCRSWVCLENFNQESCCKVCLALTNTMKRPACPSIETRGRYHRRRPRARTIKALGSLVPPAPPTPPVLVPPATTATIRYRRGNGKLNEKTVAVQHLPRIIETLQRNDFDQIVVLGHNRNVISERAQHEKGERRIPA